MVDEEDTAAGIARAPIVFGGGGGSAQQQQQQTDKDLEELRMEREKHKARCVTGMRVGDGGTSQ